MSAKKKRWLAGVVVVGLVFVTWRLWRSDLDSRFVGSWRIETTPYVYKVGADGSLIYMIGGETVRVTQWHVRNAVFYNLFNYQGWKMISAWIDRVRKGSTGGDQMFPVVSVSPDALVLREPPHGEFILLRVPDGFIPPETKPGFQIKEDMDEIDIAHEKRLRAIDPKRYADE